MTDGKGGQRRPWWVRSGLWLLVSVAVLLAVPTAVLAPYLLDDRRLDGIVRVVALDWRDFGEDRARARLEAELDQRGVGSQVRDDDCTFLEDAGDRTVSCAWEIRVDVLFLPRAVPLSFRSAARITESGDLR